MASFEILLIDPCKVTSINEWILTPIVTSISSPTFKVTLPTAVDQSSLDFGNQDGSTLCGGQKI